MKNNISVADLEHYLNTLLNIKAFNEKAYNGVQVATKVPIKKIATAVSVTKETIQKTIDANAQALIVHHGIFRKEDVHPLVGRLYDYVYQLMTHDIALLCYHLPLDAHQKVGNNWKAAMDLGLKNCTPILEYDGTYMGVLGDAHMPFDDFKKQVERYYDRSASAVKVHDKVNKVAIVSGGADKAIKDAALAGADCFITGRVDEPVWADAHEYGISFLGLGHYATETVGPKALASVIEQHFKISAIFIETDNPF
jgi:dinuclear metal center YbgI/SA1388 family protein